MALKAMVKSLDGLNDAQKALYRQEGDHFLLDVEAVDGWELTGSGLKNALQREREAREAAEKRAEAFKDIDPDKAREALGKVESMKNWTPDEKVKEQIEQRTREVAAAKDQEIGQLKGSLDLYRKGYETLTVEKALTESLEKHRFLAPKVAVKLFRDSVALVEKDGQISVAVIGTDGKPATRVDAKTGDIKALSIDEYIAEQAKRPEFAELIKGNNASGSRGPVEQNQNNNQPAGQAPATPGLDQAQAFNTLAQELEKSVIRAG